MMYYFTLCYDKDETSRINLPVAPESLETSYKGNSKVINLISSGDTSILKSAPLRLYKFKAILPKKDSPAFNTLGIIFEPLYYLNRLRLFKEGKTPVRFIILRNASDNSEIFKTNTLVSVEDYSITEYAGEEGEFWIDLTLMEYRCPEIKKVDVSNDKAFSEKIRTSKENKKTYVVRKGDSLWKIARKELNDGSKYNEIAKLNGIDNPDVISVGTTLLLP